MRTLHHVKIYQSRIKKFWVIEHQAVQLTPDWKCTIKRMHLTKVGLRAVRDQLNKLEL